jgi:class 3 adenylate cyclase
MYMKGSQPHPENAANKPHEKEVNVVSMFADLRDFSNWVVESRIEDVSSLLKSQYEQVIQVCCDCHVHFLKTLGDGFLLVWEADEVTNLETCLKRALDAAYTMHNKYMYCKRDSSYKVPAGYGIGISQGLAVRIWPDTMLRDMNEVDFVGYPLNCSARMQTLSLEAFQTTICSSVSATLQSKPDEFLYPGIPGFARILKMPSPKSIEKAVTLKGLQCEDRTNFRHLEWAAAGRCWCE